MVERMGQLSQIVTPYRAPSESTMGKSVPFGQNSFFFQFSELTKKEMRTGTKFTPKQLNAFDHHVFSSIALLLTVSQAAFLLFCSWAKLMPRRSPGNIGVLFQLSTLFKLAKVCNYSKWVFNLSSYTPSVWSGCVANSNWNHSPVTTRWLVNVFAYFSIIAHFSKALILRSWAVVTWSNKISALTSSVFHFPRILSL